MNKTVFKVIGTWGAQKYTTELGTFDTLQDAMNRVDNYHEAPDAYGLHMDHIEVVKCSESMVWFAKDLEVDEPNYPELSRLSPSAAADLQDYVDYERQGVKEQRRDPFQPFDDLQEAMRNLEDRHVGLRHELGTDLDHVYEHIDELREQVESGSADIVTFDQVYELITELREETAKEIKAVRHDVTMDIVNTDSDIRSLKNELYTLRDDVLAYREVVDELDAAMRHEVAGLRREMENLRGRTAVRRDKGE